MRCRTDEDWYMMARWQWAMLLMLGLTQGLGAEAATEKVTLYRDTWGVPHVYADTPAGGAYGMGYAQAEDRLADIYINLRTGLGSMSEAFGSEWIDQDYIMKLCRNEELSKKYWQTAAPELKSLMESFVAGIEAYISEHPEKVPEFAVPLEPWKFMTIGRAMILRWPLGTIQDDLRNKEKREAVQMRSNQWAVAPSRSADKQAILLADPHLTWEGLAVLYEGRIHAGDLQLCGYFLCGSPLMGFGHNNYVGWANTTGGPDTSDVYEMTMKSGLIPQYEYDGEWKTAQLRVISIPVKGQEKPVIRPALYTHLGPLVSEPKDGKAYVGATPYMESMKFFEQFYRMNMAKSAREFFEALGMNEYNEQNMMFADVNGTIGYVRSGRTPIRPEGYNWRAPVPGNTSATAWQGIHPVEDLVHIFDPESGYMQNCNIKPDTMMVDSPLTPDKYPSYIYNALDWEVNPRGRRATQMLHSDSSVTRAEAEAYAMDVQDMMADPWKQALREAFKTSGDEAAKDPVVTAAVEGVLAWDGQFTRDSTATVLLKNWREKNKERPGLAPLAEGKLPEASEYPHLVTTFQETVAELKDAQGKWDVPWGDLYKIGRGGQLFPIGGADFGSRSEPYNYTETLFDIKCNPDPENPGHFLARQGSMAIILMFFDKSGVESVSAVAWGQSGDPSSPHYMDQGEKLFSPRKLKPTFWRKDELMKNLSSTKTFEWTGPADAAR